MVLFEACDRAPGLSRIATDITLRYVNWYWRVSAVVMWTPGHGLDDAVGIGALCGLELRGIERGALG